MEMETTSALPVMCRQCGALFDLSYDLGEQGMDVASVIRAVRLWRATKKPMLCWDCR